MGSVSRLVKKLPNPLKDIVYDIVPFYWRNGSRYRQTLDFINKSQWWSTKELKHYQWRKLKEILIHAYTNVPYYRKVFDNLNLKPGDIKNYNDFRKLPLLTKNIIRDNFEDLKARNVPKESTTEFSTSGSTGKRLVFIGEKILYQIEGAFLERVYASHGSDFFGEKSIWLRRYVPSRGRPIFNYDPELKRMYLSAYHLTEKRLPEYINIMTKFGAKLLVGYPSSVYVLTTLLEKSKLKRPPIKVIHVASENLNEDWKEKIERYWGISVKDHYGMVEKVSLLHRCGESELYHDNLEYGFTEIINIKLGVGDIVGTGFYNYAMPLIRYKTNDKARINRESSVCCCGRGLPLTVDRVLGRDDDMLITRSGRYLPAVNFFPTIAAISGIKMFKIIQHDYSNIEIQIVPDEEFGIKTRNQLKKIMQERMGRLKFNIRLVSKIPRSKKTGKIRTIENRLINKGAVPI